MRRQGRRLSLWGVLLLTATFYFTIPIVAKESTAFAADTPTTGQLATNQASDNSKGFLNNNITYITIVVLIVIILAVMGYMIALQKKYYTGCVSEGQMTLFSNSPAGLPKGTIRSIIAFTIVVISLYFIALQLLGKDIKFPEALGSLLGAVIGFYFGSRSSAPSDTGMQQQVDDMKEQRDAARTEKDSDKTTDLLNKAKKGVALTKKVLQYLPEDQQKKYEKLLGKLDDGVNMAEKLNSAGLISDAVNKAKDAVDGFLQDNPVKGLIKKASESFQAALGVTLPQVALVTAIVGGGAGLAGMAYQKWKARVLRAPFSPAELPLKLIDANTGFSLLMVCPIFKNAFKTEIQGNDRPFMQSLVEMCIKETDTNAIYIKYKDRFESIEQFEQGLEEFRLTAADRELKDLIQNQDVFKDLGGYDGFIKMIDKIHKDKNALADLDTVVTVAENLQKEGEPVVKVFQKASQEITQ